MRAMVAQSLREARNDWKWLRVEARVECIAPIRARLRAGVNLIAAVERASRP